MKSVTIYSTPSCGYCNSAKTFFKEKGIAYTEYNVAAEPARRAEMIEKSGQMGVPVIFIDTDMVIGFNKPKIQQLLDIS